MRILLLGGTGFIGYHLIKNFHKYYEIIIVSRRPQIEHFKFDNVQYIYGDCADAFFLRRTIKKDDIVLFLAYNSVPKTSFEDPLKDITENLPLAVSLLSVLREVPIKNLIYFSSGGTVYGKTFDERPLNELHTTNPISPYGITKLAIEKYCKMFGEIFHIPITIIRPSNPYGEFQMPFKGQGFIATAMAKIIREEEITIFGKNGTIRDYIFIDDLVSAIQNIIEKQSRSGEIYNIGAGYGLDNLQVLNMISSVIKKDFSTLKIQILPDRHFDVPYNVLDISKLQNQGWNPKVSFEEGLYKTWEWMRCFIK